MVKVKSKVYDDAFLEACQKGHMDLVKAFLFSGSELDLNSADGVVGLKLLVSSQIGRAMVVTGINTFH